MGVILPPSWCSSAGSGNWPQVTQPPSGKAETWWQVFLSPEPIPFKMPRSLPFINWQLKGYHGVIWGIQTTFFFSHMIKYNYLPMSVIVLVHLDFFFFFLAFRSTQDSSIKNSMKVLVHLNYFFQALEV